MSTNPTTLQRLQSEEERLRNEMTGLQGTANEKDPDGTPSADAMVAQKRLQQLNDDYRQLLSTILTAERGGTSASAGLQVGSPYGMWGKDASGNYVMLAPPNADDEQQKAIDNQNAAMLRNERQRNFDSSGTYGTDAEIQKLKIDAANQKLSQDELNEKIRQFNLTQKNKD